MAEAVGSAPPDNPLAATERRITCLTEETVRYSPVNLFGKRISRVFTHTDQYSVRSTNSARKEWYNDPYDFLYHSNMNLHMGVGNILVMKPNNFEDTHFERIHGGKHAV